MSKLRLTIACGVYDRTQALADGSVQPEGIELQFVTPDGTVADLFREMLHKATFDVSEMSLSNYTMGLSRGDNRFVIIPVFPYRAFRQSMLWVNTASGIREPRDLIGKRMGIPEYATTALMFIRGFLQHDYGVQPRDIHWVRGREERVGLNLPEDVHLEDTRPELRMEDLLLKGEIDALASFNTPQEYWDGAPPIGRLFPNVREVELDYYRRTGIFPIMHTIAIRREIYEQHPWVAESLARAFQAAKEQCYTRARKVSAMYTLTPWLRLDIEESWRLFGGDPYPYGIEKNRRTLEAATQFSFEQRLSQRKMAVEELFAPEAVRALE